MSTMIFTSQITKHEKVETDLETIKCRHGRQPTLFKVYTGQKRKKFQGIIATCGYEDCKVYQYTIEDVVKSWNKFHLNRK